MKFWQIVSIFRDDLSSLESVFRAERDPVYLEWLTNFKELVRKQNRQILDARLPEDISERVMRASKLKFYISNGFLKVSTDQSPKANNYLTALDVYTKYGTNAVEDALEYGSFPIASPNESLQSKRSEISASH